MAGVTLRSQDSPRFPGLGGRPRLRGPARGPDRLRRRPRRAGPLSRRRPAGPPPVRHPHRHPRPPAAPLAGPLRGRRCPRPVGPSRPGAPPDGPVSPSDGLKPPRLYDGPARPWKSVREAPRPLHGHKTTPPTSPVGGASVLTGRGQPSKWATRAAITSAISPATSRPGRSRPVRRATIRPSSTRSRAWSGLCSLMRPIWPVRHSVP